MASYFPEAGNLNGSNADTCSYVAGPLSSNLGDLFELPDRSNETETESLNTGPRTTGRNLGFERDYNSLTAIRGC